MSVHRNDPCACGSGKKYKNCCWKADIKEGIRRKKKSHLYMLAVDNFRKHPLSNDHWETTNAAIDEILKKCLKNSPVLKYRPVNWIEPLFHSSFVLKYPYWKRVYEDCVVSNPEIFLSSFLFSVPYDTPLYLRIVSLLLRIQFDRLGLPRYDKLPQLPSKLATRPMGTLTLQGIPRQGIFPFIDMITNNATLEIKQFFDEIRDEPLDIKDGLSEFILFPTPLYEIKNYIDFLNSMANGFGKKYTFKAKETPINARDQYQNPINLVECMPEEIVFLRSPQFKKQFIPSVIEFLQAIYSKLGSQNKIHEVKKMCEHYLLFFKNITLNAIEPIQSDRIHPFSDGSPL